MLHLLEFVWNDHIQNLFNSLCTSIKYCSLDVRVSESHFKKLKDHKLLTSGSIKERLFADARGKCIEWFWNLYQGIFLKWRHFCLLIFTDLWVCFRLNHYRVTLYRSFQWILVEAYLAPIIIRFLKFIFFGHVLHLVARDTDFEIPVSLSVIFVLVDWCMIKMRGITAWWDSRVLGYLNDMFPSPAHVNRILIRHFNLLNSTSLININPYLISRRLWTLIKHATTAYGRFFFDRWYSPSIFNRLLQNTRNLYNALRFVRCLIFCPFNIRLRISAHVLDPECPSTYLNNKGVFEILLLRSSLGGWHYRLLANLHYSPVPIRLSITTSLLVILNYNDLRTSVRFLVEVLRMKKHPWHSRWRSHWLC